MATGFPVFGSGAYFAVSSGDGSPGNPFILQLSTGAPVASVPIFGTGANFGVASGNGSPGNPYVLSVGGISGLVTETETSDTSGNVTFTNAAATRYVVIGQSTSGSYNIVLPVPSGRAWATIVIDNSGGSTATAVNVFTGSLSGAEVSVSWTGGGSSGPTVPTASLMVTYSTASSNWYIDDQLSIDVP